LPGLLTKNSRRCGHHRCRSASILRLIGSIIGVLLTFGRLTLCGAKPRRRKRVIGRAFL